MFLLQDLRTNLSFLITITLLIMMISSVTGQPTYNYLNCAGRSNNDTANTNYKTNLNTLLGSLSSKAANGISFYNDTSNNIYSLYLCRGDVASNICQNCVDAAIQNIQQNCTSDTGAIVWYDECMLRYSDNNFFGSVELYPHVLMWNVADWNKTSPDDTDVSTLALMYQLTAKAGTERLMYAHDESDAINVTQKRYGMVQCSRDISGDACSNICLGKLMEFAEACCQEKKGWRILAPSCNLRYEERSFLTPSPVPSTPPPVPSPKACGSQLISVWYDWVVKCESEQTGAVFFVGDSSDNQKTQDFGGNGGNNTTKIVLITVPISTFLVAAFGFCFYRLFGRSKAREINGVQIEGMRQEILLNHLEGQTRKRFMVEGLDVKDDDDSGEMHYFKLTTIQIATDNFSDANKLGEGGFGPVYKGKLHAGKEIAVKRLSRNSGQGLEEFRTEVKLIIKLQHRNLVRLLGCCIEKNEMLLIYEYMANTSLDAFLFDSTKCKELDWAKRENIVNGIVKGLLYLHEDSRLKIIHRDLKASNVLLDDEMNPKISDFGTARIFYGNQIEVSTNRIVGTYGYMAPEYAMEGIFSIKSDVYSFGVLMLEIISGRRNNVAFNLPARSQGLLKNAWQLWNDGKAQEFIDRNLINDCPVRKVVRWINIALLCVQEDPDDRPLMSKVAFMLGGQSTEIAKPFEPPFSIGRYPMSDQLSSTEAETTSLNSD